MTFRATATHPTPSVTFFGFLLVVGIATTIAIEEMLVVATLAEKSAVVKPITAAKDEPVALLAYMYVCTAV